MKDCEYVKEQLSAYIDDMLPETESEKISRHLKSCQDCQADYAFLQNIQITAKNMPEIPVSSALHEKILNSLDNELQKPKKANFSFWKTTSKFTAAAAVIMISVVALNNLPMHPESTPKDIVNESLHSPTPVYDVSQPAAKEDIINDKARIMPQETDKPDYFYQTESHLSQAVEENQKNVAALSLDIEEYDRIRISEKSSAVYLLSGESIKDARHFLADYEQDGIYLIPRENFEEIHQQLLELSGYLNHEIFEPETPDTVIEVILKSN